MAHIILLGDSIFDNATYVPDGLPVIDRVSQYLSKSGDRASLLAVDGNCIHDIPKQLKRLPVDATHLFISVGGNDALRYATELQNTSGSLYVALQQIASMKTEFNQRYQGMLETVLLLNKPTVICTIYDQCPILEPSLRLLAFTALSIFNDCISRQAIELNLPLIDLRIICNEPSDYSSISPIEPSTIGGQKIARCIATVLSQHDFSIQHTVCYT